ncbi:MAG: hypothetical protein HC854_14045 [Flavobacterium sp.]|nr:hypothetical protein [Flavobacterium sp.]
MKTNLITVLLMIALTFNTAQNSSSNFTPSIVDFDAFEKLTVEVKTIEKID